MAKGGMESFVSDGEKELECGVCFEQITNAKLLNCLHTFCENCLVRLDNRGIIECPECRQKTHLPEDGVKGLPANFYFDKFRELLKAQKSLSCSCNKGSVKFYCFQCKIFYCHQCTDAHNTIKQLTEGHYVVELEKFSREDFETYVSRSGSCKQHNGEELKFYCQNCDQCICISCTVVEHQNHQRSHLADVVKQEKEDLEGKMVQMKAKKNRMEFHCKLLDDQVTAIKNEAEKAKATARETHELIIKETEKRMQETLSQIDKQAEDGVRKINNMKKAVSNKEQEMENCLEFSKGILDRTFPLEIMGLKNFLKERFQKLNRETPAQYSVEQFHIKYIRNDPEVQTGKQAISQIGTVQTCLIDPRLTQLEGSGIRQAFVGEETEFSVVTKTSNGGTAFSYEDYVTVEIESPNSECSFARVKKEKNGKYRVTFTPKCCGEHKVRIWVNGEEIADISRSVKVQKRSQPEFKFTKNELRLAFDSRGNSEEHDSTAVLTRHYKNLTLQTPKARNSKFSAARAVERNPFCLRGNNNNGADSEQQNLEKTWSCDRCTFTNPEYAQICDACASTRGVVEPPSPRGKTCPECTFINQQRARVCVVCNENLSGYEDYI